MESEMRSLMTGSIATMLGAGMGLTAVDEADERADALLLQEVLLAAAERAGRDLTTEEVANITEMLASPAVAGMSAAEIIAAMDEAVAAMDEAVAAMDEAVAEHEAAMRLRPKKKVVATTDPGASRQQRRQSERLAEKGRKF